MNRDELLAACFGDADLPREKKIFETIDGNDVVSHVGLLYRRILVRPATYAGPGVSDASDMVTVAAITNVCTDPDYRGQGFARANLDAAHADAATHQMVAFAAVFASEPVFDGFYRSRGYFHPDGAPDGFYVCPLRSDEWPTGVVETFQRW